jgi:uncharacterized protein YaiI (UPF0178 family)
VADHLSRRNLMDELRGLGIAGGGPPPLTTTDRRDFANQLDRVLAKARVK